MLAGLLSAAAGTACASTRAHGDLRSTSTASAVEEEDNEQYRRGMSAFERGDWETARQALLNFARRECQPPERAVCRPVRIDIARAEMRTGHPAAAFIGFDFLRASASPDDRQAITSERDAAWAAMKTEWAKSPAKQQVQLRFREQALGFEAESAELFIDGRRVFAAQMPRRRGEATWVPLTSLMLDRGEHVFDGRVHFNNRSLARFTARIRSAVAVTEGPVVVELQSGDATSESNRMEVPTLNLSVHQGSGEGLISPP